MQHLCYDNEFDLHENEPPGRTHFHMNGFADRLVSRQRHAKGDGNGVLSLHPIQNATLFKFPTFFVFHLFIKMTR